MSDKNIPQKPSVPPTHTNPTKTDRTALAPYNFVSLPSLVVAYSDDNPHNPFKIDHSQYDRTRWTGWIDLTIETKSPLYIRGGLEPKTYEDMQKQEKGEGSAVANPLDKIRHRPDFFKTEQNGNPVIPGSSLRGMLRTLVEIVGHGKMQPVSDRKLIYRAINMGAYRKKLMDNEPNNHYRPKIKAGFVRRDGDHWYIQPAKNINGVTYGRIDYRDVLRSLPATVKPSRLSNVKEIHDFLAPILANWLRTKGAYEVGFTPEVYDYFKVRNIWVKQMRIKRIASGYGRGGMARGVLFPSGAIGSKHSEAIVFVPDGIDQPKANDWILIPDGLVDANNDLVKDYQEQLTKEQQELLGENGVLQDKHPVFYVEDDSGELLFFGHTAMFRIPFRYSPRTLLPAAHRQEGKMDLAEAMFGMVKGNQGGVASRIFVTDAILASDNPTDPTYPWLVGPEGLTPSILASPKPTTFQHYLTQSKPDTANGADLLTYNNVPQDTTLRGYKLYWHRGDVTAKQITAEPQAVRKAPKQYTKIRPVRSGVRFTGRIYFENLQDFELGALWWALTLPAAKEEVCHKLGMGKPLGLGAVKITAVPNIQSISKRYKQLFADDTPTWQPATHSKTMPIIAQAVEEFEEWVQEKLGTKQSFAALPRIRELLAMLSFPGPKPVQTRYLEIARRETTHLTKPNEYRTRPVLPTPTKVKEHPLPNLDKK